MRNDIREKSGGELKVKTQQPGLGVDPSEA
jgi:hypothetical protein